MYIGDVDCEEGPKAGTVLSTLVPRFARDSPWFWTDVWSFTSPTVPVLGCRLEFHWLKLRVVG